VVNLSLNSGWKTIELIISILIVLMVGIVSIQVINRYFLNNPLPWTEELARILFVWITFLGALLGLRTNAHINVNSFVNRLKPEAKSIITGIMVCLSAFYFFYLLRIGIEIVQKTYKIFTPAMDVSFSYIYSAIPLSAGIMLLYFLFELYKLNLKILVFSGIISAGMIVSFFVLFESGNLAGGSLIILAVLLLVTFIFFGMPIAFSIGTSSLLFLLLYRKIPLVIIPTRMIGGIDSFPLLAVPFFVLAGELMNTGGITQRLVDLAKVIVGHIRGGLGMVVVVGEYLFSGISGSSVADVSAIGSLLIPAMKKAGYKAETSVAIISAASAMGILVPPCIAMIVLGAMTGISVGALFSAGFIPAVILAFFIMMLIYFQAIQNKTPVEKRLSIKESMKAIIGAIIPLMLPIIIFGGILSGAATATEVSVIAVIYGFIVGVFIYKEIRMNQIIPILIRTGIVTGTVIFLVGASSVLSWIFSINQIPQKIGDLVSFISSSPIIFLILCNITFLILGSVLEGLPALIILIPIFLPVLPKFGINPIHFGILAIASLGIGLFLPPIGMGIYIACTFAEIDVGKAIVPFMPYLLVLFIGLLVISYVPWFTLVLPSIFFQ
jgi:tripartite ATP-independent transporter DctM subunit